MSGPLNVRNPLVWLRRLPHRRGFGVHSPFAYDFLTQVVYAPGRYYGYKRLDAQFSRKERLLKARRVAVDRLLFRLANRWQPKSIVAVGASKRALSYLHSGCLGASFANKGREREADFVYIGEPHEAAVAEPCDGGLLVVDHLGQCRELWESLLADERVRVTFDLHDVGIAIYDPMLQPMHYVVNW